MTKVNETNLQLHGFTEAMDALKEIAKDTHQTAEDRTRAAKTILEWNLIQITTFKRWTDEAS